MHSSVTGARARRLPQHRKEDFDAHCEHHAALVATLDGMMQEHFAAAHPDEIVPSALPAMQAVARAFLQHYEQCDAKYIGTLDGGCDFF